MDVLVAILLVLVANLLAMYEINLLLLFLIEIAYARERILYLDYASSSSRVMRRLRFRVQSSCITSSSLTLVDCHVDAASQLEVCSHCS